jgi:sugar lactone lactonase YvrE
MKLKTILALLIAVLTRAASAALHTAIQIGAGGDNAVGIAYYNGAVYTANLHGKVTKLTLDLPRTSTTVLTGLGGAQGIAIDQVNGNIYTTDPFGTDIQVHDQSGALLRVLRSNLVSSANSIIFDPAGNMYVAGDGTSLMARFAPNGTVSMVAFGLDNPTQAVYKDGFIYVACSTAGTIVKIDPTTGTKSNFVTGLVEPNGLAVDIYGNMFAAETTKGFVDLINPDGSFSLYATGLNRPSALTTDELGNVYAASDRLGSQISMIAAVPEPATGIAGITLGIAGVTVRRRRK